ncbi:VrrA/YqfQ family protein [Bacillus sp. FJAT-53711]|uniref:VrrA/YqfQ family protein n=2 Tax=Bacillus yunxiaonensis TaxID=3127665 RepID=A0ABU8FTJ0_9BACI
MYGQPPYPYTMYPSSGMQPLPGMPPSPGMQPMMPKKKGFLAKLFKKNDPAADYMHMMPPYRQMETYSNVPYQQNRPYMQPQQQQQNNPYMQPQQQQKMMQPQMMAPNETRGAAGAAGSAPSGIGSFFTNFISNPTGMLNNVEKVVQMAQSVAPVVQQYSPIVRSIPNIMKILTSGKSTEEKETEEVEIITPTSPKQIPITSKPLTSQIILEDDTNVETLQPTTPKPKLYV